MGDLETGAGSFDEIAPDPEPHPGLGRAIRLLRESRGLEQYQLATKSGVSPSAISDLEEGQLDPQWSTVKRLCRVLEITLGDIAERAIDGDEPDSGRM